MKLFRGMFLKARLLLEAILLTYEPLLTYKALRGLLWIGILWISLMAPLLQVRAQSTTRDIFGDSTTAAPTIVPAGTAVALSSKIIHRDDFLPRGLIDYQIFDDTDTVVAQQQFTYDRSRRSQEAYSWKWQTSSASIPGTYTVAVGIMDITGKKVFYWNKNAALFTVARPTKNVLYSFETGCEHWQVSGNSSIHAASATEQAYSGLHSLRIIFARNSPTANSLTANDTLVSQKSYNAQVEVPSPITPAGATVTFHLWLPVKNSIIGIQPFVQQGSKGNWTWTGEDQVMANLKQGTWNTLSIKVPANAVLPLNRVGVLFTVDPTWSGNCYIDSVGWDMNTSSK